jgi:hypothetical protein
LSAHTRQAPTHACFTRTYARPRLVRRAELDIFALGSRRERPKSYNVLQFLPAIAGSMRFPPTLRGMTPSSCLRRNAIPLTSMNRVAKRACSRRGQVEGTNRSGGGRPVSLSAGSRFEPHFRKAASGGWSVVRRSTGAARHKSSRITTHDTAAELTRLISAVEKICDSESHIARNHLVTATRGTRDPLQDVVFDLRARQLFQLATQVVPRLCPCCGHINSRRAQPACAVP